MQNLIKFILQSLFMMFTLGITSISVYGQSQKSINGFRKQIAQTDDERAKAGLYLQLATNYLIKPGELAIDLDSARILNNSALKLSQRLGLTNVEAQSLLLTARIQLEIGEKPKAQKSLDLALSFTQKHALITEEGECYEVQVDFYDNENAGIEKKLVLLTKAAQKYHEGGNGEKEATALKRLADYLHIRGRDTEALPLLEKALALYHKVGFTELQGIYNLMGNVYTSQGRYNLSVKYELMAAETAEKLGDHSLQLSSIYNHLALTYYMLKDDANAYIYWQKAAKVAEKFDDKGHMQIILTNLATLCIRQRKYTEALSIVARIEKKYPPTDVYMNLRLPYLYFNTYMKMGRFNKLKPYYDKLRMYESTLPADDANQIYLLESIISYLINKKELRQVYPFLRKEDKLLSNSHNYMMLSRHHYRWFKADSLAGNTQAALNHFITYKSLSDSVFNAEKANQISTLQIGFETGQKDRNIKLLTQKNSLQAETIRKDRIINLSMAGASALFFLLLVLGWLAYRAKQKSNTQLRQKQEEINKQYDTLKRVLSEKEWLLREIHHRVKNNLQIVISLLNSQSAYMDNQDAMDAIQNSQHRMHAMSLIHQKLYQSENLATINMKWYVQELIAYMRDCFDIDSKIRFVIEAEDLSLDVAQAVPVGLILNEAVTNSIKYAFTDGRFGTISIHLQQDAQGNCAITLKDNGRGLPENFDIAELNSLGLNLMMGLAEQLEGRFNTINNNGLTIAISFPIKRNFNSEETPSIQAA